MGTLVSSSAPSSSEYALSKPPILTNSRPSRIALVPASVQTARIFCSRDRADCFTELCRVDVVAKRKPKQQQLTDYREALPDNVQEILEHYKENEATSFEAPDPDNSQTTIYNFTDNYRNV